jgi:hypothetical protein
MALWGGPAPVPVEGAEGVHAVSQFPVEGRRLGLVIETRRHTLLARKPAAHCRFGACGGGLPNTPMIRGKSTASSVIAITAIAD